MEVVKHTIGAFHRITDSNATRTSSKVGTNHGFSTRVTG